MAYGKSTAYLLAFGGRPSTLFHCSQFVVTPVRRQGIGTQPNAMSGSKLGNNGLALFLSARKVMGHS